MFFDDMRRVEERLLFGDVARTEHFERKLGGVPYGTSVVYGPPVIVQSHRRESPLCSAAHREQIQLEIRGVSHDADQSLNLLGVGLAIVA